eukprot:1150333-Pelagomonas_calceolata.AAC.4
MGLPGWDSCGSPRHEGAQAGCERCSTEVCNCSGKRKITSQVVHVYVRSARRSAGHACVRSARCPSLLVQQVGEDTLPQKSEAQQSIHLRQCAHHVIVSQRHSSGTSPPALDSVPTM